MSLDFHGPSSHTYVSTKWHKGVPPCRLYKGLRRKIALDFSRLIILNLDIHTWTTWKTDNGLLFYALSIQQKKYSHKRLRISVQTEISTMIHGFGWRPNVLI